MTKNFVVSFGNPFDGVTLYGPFSDSGDALDWAEANRLEDINYHVIQVHPAYSLNEEAAA